MARCAYFHISNLYIPRRFSIVAIWLKYFEHIDYKGSDGVHRLNIKNIFRRKSAAGQENKSKEEMPYVPSPSAMQYPGVKAEPKAAPAPKPAAIEPAKKDASGLPKCPKCGWSIGYTDTKCSNCGSAISLR